MNTPIEREQILYDVTIGFEYFNNTNLTEFINQISTAELGE